MYSVLEKTVSQLQNDMEQGITTSEEITLSYLMRIAKRDKSGPKVNSVLEINPDAVFIARSLDRERKLSGPRGPMHGIPVLLKDNISTCDKMHTSAGAASLANNFALADAWVVEELRAAGAVILGMTFIAGAFSEPKLLAYGYAFECASHLRVVPEAAKAECGL